MHRSDESETDPTGKCVCRDNGRCVIDPGEKTEEDMSNRWLTHPTECERRQGDPELTGGDVLVEVINNL